MTSLDTDPLTEFAPGMITASAASTGPDTCVAPPPWLSGLPPLATLTTAVALHDSPIGRLTIHTRFDAVCRLDIASNDDDLDDDYLSPLVSSTPLLDDVKRQLDEYFSGSRHDFALPLAANGTSFQQEVWDALGRVPFGETTTYGRLATTTGRPTGARAVGGAVRANPIAVLVPCHRVLGGDGRLTGYTPGRGLETKKWLLRHESVDSAA